MKHKVKNPHAIEGFSVLKMKQEIQDAINRDIEGMTREEILEYFHQGSERLRKETEMSRQKETQESP